LDRPVEIVVATRGVWNFRMLKTSLESNRTLLERSLMFDSKAVVVRIAREGLSRAKALRAPIAALWQTHSVAHTVIRFVSFPRRQCAGTEWMADAPCRGTCLATHE
jgi:hypothetical protein